jgi:hypothetical protein
MLMAEMQGPWRKSRWTKKTFDAGINPADLRLSPRSTTGVRLGKFNYPVLGANVCVAGSARQAEINVLNVMTIAAEFLGWAVRSSRRSQGATCGCTRELESFKEMLTRGWAHVFLHGVDQPLTRARRSRCEWAEVLLLGQTLQCMGARRFRDRTSGNLKSGSPLAPSQRRMAGVAQPRCSSPISALDLYDLPKSHRDGPFFLNVSRYLDMPQAVAMAAERSKVVLYQDDDTGWEYPRAVAEKLGWDAKQIKIRKKPE